MTTRSRNELDELLGRGGSVHAEVEVREVGDLAKGVVEGGRGRGAAAGELEKFQPFQIEKNRFESGVVLESMAGVEGKAEEAVGHFERLDERNEARLRMIVRERKAEVSAKLPMS